MRFSYLLTFVALLVLSLISAAIGAARLIWAHWAATQRRFV